MRNSIVLVFALAVMIKAGVALFAQGAQPDSVFTIGNKDGGKQETTLGDLTTDAMRTALKTDIAFLAASELKVLEPPVPAQNIQPPVLITTISFPDDPLAVLQLTGKQVKAALERGVSLYPQRNLGFLQVAGIKFTFDPKKPNGKRVSAVVVGKEPLDDNRTYTVAVTNSMANGALGYWNVWKAENIVKRVPEQSLKKALNSYLGTSPKLQYKVPSRVMLPEP